ncbi:uncharacterized protein PG998_006175 [Apiospora kogelbergensis]|uniref:uncharacterized protein n=1 Tax=Apiospora kogelbergensis TaxID=1337665 RepID=UPI0031321E49
MAEIPPGPTLTKGLDFSSNKIGNRDVSSADAVYKRAVAIIKEKLPLMSELNALLAVNLGDGKPLIAIDARLDDAKLVDLGVREPDTKITIKPEYISQFYEGKLEPRYGLFKDAFFHEASMPQGNIPVAIKFADLLTPEPPTPPRRYQAGMRVPQPTEDIEQVKRDIAEFGYGLVANALTPSQVDILRSALKQQAEGERLWTLINKGDEFVDFLNHPLLDAVVPWFLGQHAVLTSYTANIARPGNVPMQLHTDQVAIQPPQRGLAYGLNVMWYLTDVADRNGGTRVFPGSHRGPVAPADLFDLEGTVAAEAPAGSALVFESRLWHATGPNRETTRGAGDRPVVMMFFMRSFVRQQENNFLSLRPEVETKLSDRAKRMLGFCTTGALGGVEGRCVRAFM